jgi:hypothetical protein
LPVESTPFHVIDVGQFAHDRITIPLDVVMKKVEPSGMSEKVVVVTVARVNGLGAAYTFVSTLTVERFGTFDMADTFPLSSTDFKAKKYAVPDASPVTSIVWNVPGEAGTGSPTTCVATAKFSSVINATEYRISYAATTPGIVWPVSRKSAGAVQPTVIDLVVATLTYPGGAASGAASALLDFGVTEPTVWGIGLAAKAAEQTTKQQSNIIVFISISPNRKWNEHAIFFYNEAYTKNPLLSRASKKYLIFPGAPRKVGAQAC